MSNLYEQILKKEAKIGVIGLGYVGLPIALAFAKKVAVVGFDINAERVEMMKNHVDPSDELEASDFADSDITFTAKTEDLKDVNFFIVAVPTPIDAHNTPDLRPLIGASNTVGAVLKKGRLRRIRINGLPWMYGRRLRTRAGRKIRIEVHQ